MNSKPSKWPPLPSVDELFEWTDIRRFLAWHCLFGLGFRYRHARRFFDRLYPAAYLTKATSSILNLLACEGYYEKVQSFLPKDVSFVSDPADEMALSFVAGWAQMNGDRRFTCMSLESQHLYVGRMLAAKNWPAVKAGRWRDAAFFVPTEKLCTRLGKEFRRHDLNEIYCPSRHLFHENAGLDFLNETVTHADVMSITPQVKADNLAEIFLIYARSFNSACDAGTFCQWRTITDESCIHDEYARQNQLTMVFARLTDQARNVTAIFPASMDLPAFLSRCASNYTSDVSGLLLW